MSKIASKTSWKTYPIINPKRIEIDLGFTDEHFSKLIKGLIPQQMEDKWFIYYENEWIYLHRSWTGYGVYKTKLNKETNGYSIKEFWAERNQERYRNENDNSDIETFSFLIAMGLLGVDVGDIYSNRNTNSESNIIEIRHFTESKVDTTYTIQSALFGVAIGDALGVPFEFSSRDKMKTNPAQGMIGFGTYNQPKGTWSDDSSLTFCLAESLIGGYNLEDISKKFIKWKHEAYWSARGEVFDIGTTTSIAISRLKQIIETGDLEELKRQKYYGDEFDNGNGSLMRIIPLLFYIKGKPIKEQFEIVWEISALTHRHIRAAMSCTIYLKLAEKLLEGKDKETAYSEMRIDISKLWDEIDFSECEREHFKKLIQNDIRETEYDDLKSGGYVIEVLESSIWFFLNCKTFEETILSIINIGHDTDTSAAIAGGLAGLYYGYKGIPSRWIDHIARKNDIDNLAKGLAIKLDRR